VAIGKGPSNHWWDNSPPPISAAQNVRQIYLHLQQRTNESISSEMLQLPKDVDQFGEFLRQFNLKRFKLNGTEHILLDCANAYRSVHPFWLSFSWKLAMIQAATIAPGHSIVPIQPAKVPLR
jgi:hypothetical protein